MPLPIELAQQLGALLEANAFLIATAESCTGGGVAAALTAIPGSSAWFERGFVTYSNQAKVEMLGVSLDTLASQGAVSEAVAREMAVGALRHSHAQVSVAITGIAGPAGGTPTKPVGTVCFAWARDNRIIRSATRQFTGDRETVRQQASQFALAELLAYLAEEK